MKHILELQLAIVDLDGGRENPRHLLGVRCVEMLKKSLLRERSSDCA